MTTFKLILLRLLTAIVFNGSVSTNQEGIFRAKNMYITLINPDNVAQF